jgi:hypothetical protein
VDGTVDQHGTDPGTMSRASCEPQLTKHWFKGRADYKPIREKNMSDRFVLMGGHVYLLNLKRYVGPQ